MSDRSTLLWGAGPAAICPSKVSDTMPKRSNGALKFAPAMRPATAESSSRLIAKPSAAAPSPALSVRSGTSGGVTMPGTSLRKKRAWRALRSGNTPMMTGRGKLPSIDCARSMSSGA